MALALLTRADESLAAEWAAGEWPEQGYEVLLVCDTSGSSPGNPWAVFVPPWTWSAMAVTLRTRSI